MCALVNYVRSQILREKTRGKRPISDKIGKTEKKRGLEIGRGSSPMTDLRFCEKKRVGDVRFQIKSEKQKKRGLEIGRGSGPTPVARGGSGAKALPLAARPVPLNGRGRRLVELTNGC